MKGVTRFGMVFDLSIFDESFLDETSLFCHHSSANSVITDIRKLHVVKLNACFSWALQLDDEVEFPVAWKNLFKNVIYIKKLINNKII